jgi:integrase
LRGRPARRSGRSKPCPARRRARSSPLRRKDDRLGNLFAIALHTGLRQGELLGLRWPDVDLAGGSLRVRKAIQKHGGAWHFVDPKSESSRRTVRLSPAAIAVLADQKQRVGAMRRALGAAWQEWGLVFPSQVGTPLDGANVTKHLQRKLQEANLPVVTFHALRHTCATLLLEQGIPARVVMDQLGHSQISLTLNTYSHVRPAMQTEAADALQRALGG